MKQINTSLFFLLFLALSSKATSNDSFGTVTETQDGHTQIDECQRYQEPSQFSHFDFPRSDSTGSFYETTVSSGTFYDSSDKIQYVIDIFASKKCKSSESSAMFDYTSLKFCTFKLHSIKDQNIVPYGYYSSACSDSNVVDIMKAYMINDPPQEKIVVWPDVCVGDFQRCYDVKRDREIFLRHICTSPTSILKKDLPESTTHISVDCREDKLLQIDWAEDYKEFALERKKEEVVAYGKRSILLTTLVYLVLLVITCIFWFAVKLYVVTPFSKLMKRKRSDLEQKSFDDNSVLLPFTGVRSFPTDLQDLFPVVGLITIILFCARLGIL